jgi:hypothetical protein
MVYEPSTAVRLYINGILDNSNTTSIPATQYTANGLNAYIGARGGGSLVLTGKIDDLKIYDYVRSSTQIAWEFSRGAPIAHWKFNECSGSTAFDKSGNNNNGTIIAGSGPNGSLGTCGGSAGSMWADGASGKRNASLEFDGSDDYVNIPHNSALAFDSGSQDFSLFAWVKFDSLGSGRQEVISKLEANSDGWFLGNVIQEKPGCNVDSISILGNTTFSTGQWYFIGCTIDRDGFGKVYVNGIQEGAPVSIGSEAMSTTIDLSIGKSAGGGGRFNGEIDEPMIFNYVLTSEQVKNLFNSGVLNFD